MSELCGTFSPAFIKITYVLINIDFSVEQFGLCNLLPSAYFFIFLSLDYVHIFAHICIPVLFFRLSCRGKRRFWSWRICVPKTTLTTAASPLSEMCVGFLTAVLSSDLPIRQVLHIITDFCAQKAYCNQIIISYKKKDVERERWTVMHFLSWVIL